MQLTIFEHYELKGKDMVSISFQMQIMSKNMLVIKLLTDRKLA